MRRRDFLAMTGAAAVLPAWARAERLAAAGHEGCTHAKCGPGYAGPAEAMAAPREKLLYTVAIYVGTGKRTPDQLVTIDADPASPTYSKVIHRLPMPNHGDELHHFGWNACSSCHGDATKSRRYIVLPGLASGRIHIVDAVNPRQPKHHKVIEPETVADKVDLSAPHTVHCLADGHVMISMLGDGRRNGPGGFLLLDESFNVAGRWEKGMGNVKYNYDFWYQPRHDVMVSSEWAAPRTYSGGFDLKDVDAGKYGSCIHFWDWSAHKLAQTIDLGPNGLIPLEVRFHHDPKSHHGFVGAALSSTMWHLHQADGQWKADKVIAVEPVEVDGWSFPVPGLITDLVVSMDDRFLYFSNWLHGDVRQYDISDPSRPKLVGRVWCGGLTGRTAQANGKKLVGGPQMLQLSLDGKRLYVTSSLISSWDNQFYPKIAEEGSYLIQIDCDTRAGGLKINDDFFVDFGKEPAGPARAHEVRFPGGDCTSDIFV